MSYSHESFSMKKRGKVYTLNQWLAVGGKRSDLNRCPSFHKSGSVSGMRKLYYGYACDMVKSGDYIYVIR